MANPTLLDIAIANAADPAVGLIEESIQACPELTLGAARPIKGILYKTLVRTALPSVAFRDANEGTATTKGTYENRTIETFIMNPMWNCDKAVADGFEDGAPAFIAMEGLGLVESAMRTICRQMYYGKRTAFSGDAKGFPGLLDSVNATMVVDAGGTTDNVASSVWAVKFGPQDVQWVWGLNGDLKLSDPIEQQINDANSNPYIAYVQNLLARPGIQVGRYQAIGRIKKLTTDVGKTLTDSLLGDLLALFPVGLIPDCFLMTRRSLQQLRKSRTATNPTGVPAPIPSEAFGVPIYPTDSIVNTETLAL
jgi:hypothetical protein